MLLSISHAKISFSSSGNVDVGHLDYVDSFFPLKKPFHWRSVRWPVEKDSFEIPQRRSFTLIFIHLSYTHVDLCETAMKPQLRAFARESNDKQCRWVHRIFSVKTLSHLWTLSKWGNGTCCVVFYSTIEHIVRMGYSPGMGWCSIPIPCMIPLPVKDEKRDLFDKETISHRWMINKTIFRCQRLERHLSVGQLIGLFYLVIDASA
jgi:hypothetical protein